MTMHSTDLQLGKIYEIGNSLPCQVIAVSYYKKTGAEVVTYQELVSPFQSFVVDSAEFRSMLSQPEYSLPNDGDRVKPSFQKLPEMRRREVVREPQKAEEITLAFLDEHDYAAKLDILTEAKGKVTDRMLDDFAMSMDLQLNQGSADEKYFAIKRHLEMLLRFEGRRLR